MSYQVAEQVLHDRINLLRLVRRLEKSVDSDEWLEDTREPSRAAWIKAQGVLQVGVCFGSHYYYRPHMHTFGEVETQICPSATQERRIEPRLGRDIVSTWLCTYSRWSFSSEALGHLLSAMKSSEEC